MFQELIATKTCLFKALALTNGMKFGFFKFREVEDVERMARILDSIWIDDFKLRVFIATGNGQKKSGGLKRGLQGDGSSRMEFVKRGARSFSDVVKNRRETVEGNNILDISKEIWDEMSIYWKLNSDMQEFLGNCLVGKVDRINHIVQVCQLCT